MNNTEIKQGTHVAKTVHLRHSALLIFSNIFEIFFKLWYNSSSSLIVDMFRFLVIYVARITEVNTFSSVWIYIFFPSEVTKILFFSYKKKDSGKMDLPTAIVPAKNLLKDVPTKKKLSPSEARKTTSDVQLSEWLASLGIIKTTRTSQHYRIDRA